MLHSLLLPSSTPQPQQSHAMRSLALWPACTCAGGFHHRARRGSVGGAAALHQENVGRQRPPRAVGQAVGGRGGVRVRRRLGAGEAWPAPCMGLRRAPAWSARQAARIAAEETCAGRFPRLHCRGFGPSCCHALPNPNPAFLSPCSFNIKARFMHDLSVDGFAERTASGFPRLPPRLCTWHVPLAVALMEQVLPRALS